MKRVQLSGAQKRKLAKKKQEKTLDLDAKTAKLTSFFRQIPKHDTLIPGQSQSLSSEVDTNAINSTLITSESKCDKVSQAGSSSTCAEIEINSTSIEITAKDGSVADHGDGDENNLSAKDEVNHNVAKDPGLWLDFSTDDVAYWIACGPSDCQHHNGPFDKSNRHFSSGKPVRYCSQKLFVGTKGNGEKYKREWLMYSPSTGSVYCFVCKLFAPKNLSNFVTREGFSDWRNTIVIDNHEKSTTHRDSMLTYLTRRQGAGLGQQLEKQIQEECDYWEHVLRRVIAVICTLAERGLAFRGTDERFGSLQNGNFLGLLELISQFDPFLARHISKYGNAGKGNPSYLSKTTCEELIQIMAQRVHTFIVDEVKSSSYFSLSVDSTPDLSHIDQLSIVLRYLKDGQPIERFLTFLELESHTGEDMANQVLQY